MVKDKNIIPAKAGTVFIFQNQEEISSYMIKTWGELCNQAIREKDRFSVALSGGETPILIYRDISRVDEAREWAWDKTHIFQVDERFVPITHPDSNYRMIKKTLLNAMHIPPANIHAIPIERNVDFAAEVYAKEIQTSFRLNKGSFPQFDLILLGIGKDGHTASLFPNSPAIDEQSRLVAGVHRNNQEHDRVTLTIPTLNHAKYIIFLVIGKNKAQIIKEVIQGNSCVPAGLINAKQGKVIYVLDSTAAGQLNSKFQIPNPK